jgi:hypothetical protein
VERRLLAVILGLLLLPTHAIAQSDDTTPAPASRTVDTAKFLSGAALAFLIHEGGHLVFDEAFDAHPQLQWVHFGPVPFFAITPTRPLSARELFTVASAGFWTQEITSDVLQPRHRDLRHEHAPLAKGMLAFDILTSIGYAATAFAQSGPVQRDTRGMAASLDVPEPAIGALILTPAILEAYRYFRPESRWARWATRIAAAGSVVLVLSAPNSRD